MHEPHELHEFEERANSPFLALRPCASDSCERACVTSVRLLQLLLRWSASASARWSLNLNLNLNLSWTKARSLLLPHRRNAVNRNVNTSVSVTATPDQGMVAVA